jgi:atypical dual specificity phosphatase
MSKPNGFSWVDKPLLAAMGRPESPEDLDWLRKQGIDLIVSLLSPEDNDPPPTPAQLRRWVNDAGMMLVAVPVPDFSAPTPEDLDRCVSTINKAQEKGFGVVVHCGGGLGRTGVVLACYFVDRGLGAQNAIARVRRLRPGSIETPEQAEAVEEFARRQRRAEGGESLSG